MEPAPAHATQQQQRLHQQQQLDWRQQLSRPQLQEPMLQARSPWVVSAGHQLMVWPMEDVPRAPSVDPGCLMEAPGTGPPPGTAWPHPDWPPGLPVTTATLSRWVSVTLG